MQILGNITLNISLIIYLIWLLPQLLLNFKRKDTQGVSLLMHGILCIGYISDLLYGFGREMQWQYRLITIIGLCSLAIQHYQFWHYGMHRITQKMTYSILNIIYLSLITYAVAALKAGYYSREFYDLIGMLANVCWLSYMLPQIAKNFVNRSTFGFSTHFIFLSIFLNLCDATSAWTLEWDYPSKVGPIVTLIGNLILLCQVQYYAKKEERLSQISQTC